MKHRLLYLALIATLSFTSTAKAQIDCYEQYWGSQSRYPFPTLPRTLTPAEYTPVFVNYVGRYGSSHMLKDLSTSATYRLLQKADSAHALKDDGKKLHQMLISIQKIEKPLLGGITLTGSDEMKSIGARLYANNQPVFKTNNCIKISEANDKRVQQSAEALLSGMNRNVNAPGCEPIDLKDDDNLQPFKVSPVLQKFAEKGDWKDNADDYCETKAPKNFTTKFLARFFLPDFIEALDDDTQSKFAGDMYNLSLYTGAITQEITAAGLSFADVDIRSFFNCDQLELFYRANSIGEFYKMAAGNDKTGIQVRSAVPLLINLLNTTDAYSMDSKISADIRLTTEESIGALATLLNFKDYSKIANKIDKVEDVWKAGEVIPYCANIQMIFYKGTTADTRSYFLVKFLLNEREVEIDGLKTKTDACYLWDDVKAFYKKKLAEDFDIESLRDNMHTYLLNVK